MFLVLWGGEGGGGGEELVNGIIVVESHIELNKE